jgi:uncharacterized LabA/DUF88 family protein
MLFVDGENLTMRYQDTLKAGRKPRKAVTHLQDTYVWSPRVTHTQYSGLPNVVRVHYYTSVTGDHDKIDETCLALSRLSFASPSSDGYHNAQLVPTVFKKPKRSQKTRNVDIQIVIDVLRSSFTASVDRIYLASGDGDYLPLISEVMRKGTQLELLAFKSGLNPALESAVDRVHLLEDAFFEDE